ncbi:MAG: sigma-70 family RNA polymerase sigma factor [Prolixibacteraceae bacterium]|nr:sigma-70 family RNA polymerase sigma factor [Prolixibacteraceae bacterium]
MAQVVKDQIVWNSFREGNRDALEIIYEENYSSLFHYGLKFTSDDDTVKDLIQELFIELIDSGEKLSATDNIRFYLLKALRNKLLKQLAANPKQKNDHPDIAGFTLVESIENQLIKREMEETVRKRVIASVGKLSKKQQEIIYLRFYNDLSYQKIAELFGVKIQTVRNLMGRAIQSLKEDLEKNRIDKQIILFVLSLPV